MKISISPLPKLIAAAEIRVTDAYAPSAMDLVHDRKRQIAQAIIDGAEPTEEFSAAAEIEGWSPYDLALVITNKPDDLMVRENLRRSVILELRALTKAEQIAPLLATYGIALRSSIASPLVLP